MPEHPAENKNPLAFIVIVVILLAIGIFFLNQRQSNKECADRATTAALDTYPINEYPNTAERERLQNMYKQTYMESCK